jgi:hypothetical protein
VSEILAHGFAEHCLKLPSLARGNVLQLLENGRIGLRGEFPESTHDIASS